MTKPDFTYAVTQFATWNLNGVCVPIGNHCAESEMEYFLKDSQADLFIADDEYMTLCEGLCKHNDIPIMNIGLNELSTSLHNE